MPTEKPVYTRTTALASGIPLGGLGAGCFEIREDGRFHNWQIFNNYPWSGNRDDHAPDAWSEDAFFALRWKQPDNEPKVRLLYDDDKKQYGVSNWYNHALIYNYPFVRNIRGLRYEGRHPFATIDYEEPACPLRVRQVAFTPFIPFDSKNSALPLAYFRFEISNESDAECEASLMFSLRNFAGYDLQEPHLDHRLEPGAADEPTLLTMTATNLPEEHRTAGTQTIAAWGGDSASYQVAWTDGRGLQGFENAATPAMSQVFTPLRDTGALPDGPQTWDRKIKRRGEATTQGLHLNRQHGWRWRGALCQKVTLKPGETREIVFLASWHFPFHRHYFDGRMLGHKYTEWFADSPAVARHGIAHFDEFQRKSRAFCDATFAGNLDPALTFSLNAQLTTFAHAFWWTADDGITAWEGMACCQTIANAHTHWSSFQPLMLFPDIYRRMKNGILDRMLAEKDGCDEDSGGCCGSNLLEAERDRRATRVQEQQKDLGGWFSQRYEKLGYSREDFARFDRNRRKKTSSWGFTHLRSANQLLRDYLWTGDRRMLESLWPFIREGLENSFERDTNGDGLPDGAVTGITYDHWFLPATNVYTGTMYLGELSCGVRLAEILDEPETAGKLREHLERGIRGFQDLYWNGEYYDLCYDPNLDRNDPGCMADQVSGLLYTNLCGAARAHAAEPAREALRAVIRHNLQGEYGLLNGADPKPRTDWRYFARYSARGEDESMAGQWVTPWTGTEFYVAATMLSEGLVEEALAIVRNVHERHTSMGMIYNHMECGEHYFRPMVAWAMLPALQGILWDCPNQALTIHPKVQSLEGLFMLPGAWGALRHEPGETRLSLGDGELTVRTLTIPAPKDGGIRVTLDNRDQTPQVAPDGEGLAVMTFREPITLSAGATLKATRSGPA
ncbi:MAG: GH116 family glycosyl-hydrolase [Opitutales bacterium]